MALDLGEVEFLRGDFFRPEALLTGAGQTLTDDVRGFPRWSKLINLYKIGCQIFATNLQDNAAHDTLAILPLPLTKFEWNSHPSTRIGITSISHRRLRRLHCCLKRRLNRTI